MFYFTQIYLNKVNFYFLTKLLYKILYIKVKKCKSQNLYYLPQKHKENQPNSLFLSGKRESHLNNYNS